RPVLSRKKCHRPGPRLARGRPAHGAGRPRGLRAGHRRQAGRSNRRAGHAFFLTPGMYHGGPCPPYDSTHGASYTVQVGHCPTIRTTHLPDTSLHPKYEGRPTHTTTNSILEDGLQPLRIGRQTMHGMNLSAGILVHDTWRTKE